MKKRPDLKRLSPLARAFIGEGLAYVCQDSEGLARMRTALERPGSADPHPLLATHGLKRMLLQALRVSLRLSDEHCYQHLARARSALDQVQHLAGLDDLRATLSSVASRVNETADELHALYLELCPDGLVA